MNTRFLTILSLLAFLGISGLAVAHPCQPGQTHDDNKHCPDADPPPGVMYTVTLTGGPFAFGPVDVSLGSKGNELNGELLTITPGGSSLAWNEVFAKCAREMDQVDVKSGYPVSSNDWSVKTNSDNDIHITINGIIVEGWFNENEVKKEIDIHLDGLPDGRFLPTGSPGNDYEDYTLNQNIIWGKPWSGHGRAWDTCYASDHPLWTVGSSLWDGHTVLRIAIKPDE